MQIRSLQGSRAAEGSSHRETGEGIDRMWSRETKEGRGRSYPDGCTLFSAPPGTPCPFSPFTSVRGEGDLLPQLLGGLSGKWWWCRYRKHHAFRDPENHEKTGGTHEAATQHFTGLLDLAVVVPQDDTPDTVILQKVHSACARRGSLLVV